MATLLAIAWKARLLSEKILEHTAGLFREIFTTLLSPGQSVAYELRPGRSAWVHVARGEVEVGGQTLASGDAAAASDEPRLEISARAGSEVLLFDLA